MAVNDYIIKEERSQINNLTLYFMELEEQTKLKARRRKEIMNIIIEITKTEL